MVVALVMVLRDSLITSIALIAPISYHESRIAKRDHFTNAVCPSPYATTFPLGCRGGFGTREKSEIALGPAASESKNTGVVGKARSDERAPTTRELYA